MHLVSFVCLRAWTGPAGKGAGFGSTKGGGGPPPPSEGGGGPPPPLQPPKLSNTPRGHTLAGASPRGLAASMNPDAHVCCTSPPHSVPSPGATLCSMAGNPGYFNGAAGAVRTVRGRHPLCSVQCFPSKLELCAWDTAVLSQPSVFLVHQQHFGVLMGMVPMGVAVSTAFLGIRFSSFQMCFMSATTFLCGTMLALIFDSKIFSEYHLVRQHATCCARSVAPSCNTGPELGQGALRWTIVYCPFLYLCSVLRLSNDWHPIRPQFPTFVTSIRKQGRGLSSALVSLQCRISQTTRFFLCKMTLPCGRCSPR